MYSSVRLAGKKELLHNFKKIFCKCAICWRNYFLHIAHHSSWIRGLCSMKWPNKTLSNLTYLLLTYLSKISWAQSDDWKISYSKYMRNLDAFLWVISLNTNLLFLKGHTCSLSEWSYHTTRSKQALIRPRISSLMVKCCK